MCESSLGKRSPVVINALPHLMRYDEKADIKDNLIRLSALVDLLEKELSNCNNVLSHEWMGLWNQLDEHSSRIHNLLIDLPIVTGDNNENQV